MDHQWEAEVWQGENGRWRWSLFRDDENVATGPKSVKTRTEALEAAKAKRRQIEENAGPKRSRVVLGE